MSCTRVERPSATHHRVAGSHEAADLVGVRLRADRERPRRHPLGDRGTGVRRQGGGGTAFCTSGMLFQTRRAGKSAQLRSAHVPPDWQLRTPGRPHAPYVADGSWNDDTLGEILAAGLADAGHLALKVRSRLRPYSGTLADVADLARRVAGGLRPGRRAR